VGTGPQALDWSTHPGLPALSQALAESGAGPWAVAFSGGADSTALLLALWHMRPGAVCALHIHHGLQAAADGFADHAQRFCAHWGIPLHLQHVQVALGPGVSTEAAAREARYPALAALARTHGARSVWLAQHLHDQVETVLLALTRGAGLPGLSGMAPLREHDGMRFVRPWLAVSGQALRQWLSGQGVACIEDPSNHDLRHTRNRLRHRLLPVLEEAFAGYAPAMARSARHAAQAQALLDEIAQMDGQWMGDPPLLQRLQTLSPARQANALRAWLSRVGARQASDAQLRQLQQQIAACTTRGHRIHLRVGLGHVRRLGAQLVFEPLAPANL
jgi:tRNA(Ile)-lysidine synthase